MQLLLFGHPSAGIDTIGTRLSNQLQLSHLTLSEVLNEATQRGSQTGTTLKNLIDRGELVPAAVLIDVIHEKLKTTECSAGFVLHGFPKDTSQAQLLDQLLHELGRPLTLVVHVQVSAQILLERMINRQICSNKSCNRIYHQLAPPHQDNHCDLCRSEVVFQLNPELNRDLTLAKLKGYCDRLDPMIEYYQRRKLLSIIDGNNSDVTFANVLDVIKQIRGVF